MKQFCYSLVSKSDYHNSMDGSPTGFSGHGILQLRILSGLPFPFPVNLPGSKIQSASALAGRFFITALPGKHDPRKEKKKEIGTNFFWTITGGTLSIQWVSHSVLGRNSRWARVCWSQLPEENIRGITSPENTQQQQEAPPTPRL